MYLSTPEPGIFFSDNYFDVLPGDTTEIRIRTGRIGDRKVFESGLSVVSLVDSYE